MSCFCAVLYLVNTYMINMLVGSLVNICVRRFIVSLFLSYLSFLPRNKDIHSFIFLTYLCSFHDLNQGLLYIKEEVPQSEL